MPASPSCAAASTTSSGVVNARKLLSRVARGSAADLTLDLQAPLYVPETLTGMELLDNFRSSGVQMAFVIDEYGEMLGIVTLQDLIEAITGEFQPRDPETSWAMQRADGTWLLDGLIPLPELKDRLALDAVPEEERGRYHTLSGMLMLLTGRLPRVCDTVDWEQWRFEIVDMDGKKIDKVLASRIDTSTIEHAWRAMCRHAMPIRCCARTPGPDCVPRSGKRE